MATVTDERLLEYLKKEEGVRRWIEKVFSNAIKLEGELVDLLKNGVTLAYLMEEIEPRSIPRIQEQTTQIYKFKENIYFFLSAIEDFGIPKYKLFRDVDLFEGTGIVKVVECLCDLASLAHSKKNLPALVLPEGWTVEKVKQLDSKVSKDLKSQLSKIKEKPKATGKLVKMSSAIFKRKLQLFSNNNLDSKNNFLSSSFPIKKRKLFFIFKIIFIVNKLEKGVAKFQAIFRGHMARKICKKMSKNLLSSKKKSPV